MAKQTKSTPSKRGGSVPRWTDEQITLLMETVKSSKTAKDAFEKVAKQLGKNVGTVSQKYYNLQRGGSAGAGRSGRRGRRTAASTTASATRRTPATTSVASDMPTAAALRDVTVDELVQLANRVKSEIDRRSKELATAKKLLAG